MPSTIYDGAMYEGAGERRRGGGGVGASAALVPDNVAAREAGAGGARNAEELSKFAVAIRDRFDYTRKTEAEAKMREEENKLQVALQEGMSAPYGSGKSLYDANGMLRQEKFEGMVGSATQAGIAGGQAIVNPMDREDWVRKSALWANTLKARAQAMVIDDGRRKAEQAFDSKYRLAMAGNDYGGAAAAAEEAYRRGVITRDAMDIAIFGAEKRAFQTQVEQMVVDGRTEEIVGMRDRGELDKYYTPYEQDRLLEAAKNTLKQRARDAEEEYLKGLDKGMTLPAAAVKEGLAADKKAYMVQGAFTESEAGLLKRMERGEDVRAAVVQDAVNEALAVPASGNYTVWESGFRARKKAMGLKDEEVTNILKEAEKVKKGLEGMRVIHAEEFASALRDTGGILNAERAKKVAGVMEMEDWFEKGSEWRRKYAWQYDITEQDDKNKAREKYQKAKIGVMMDEDIKTVTARYNAWLGTEEGQKSTPVSQELKFESLYEEVAGVKINLKNNAQGTEYAASQDVAYKTAVQAQDAKYTARTGKGQVYVDIDASMYSRRYGGQGAITVNEGGDTEEVGIYLPEALKGKVEEGGGVLCEGENGGYRELPVLGYVKGEQPQLSKKAEGVLAINKDRPPVWSWQVVRKGEHERLMRAQEVNEERMNELEAARMSALGSGNRSAVRRMAQPGYMDLRDSPRLRAWMGRLAPYYEDFVAAARKYDIDPRLLISIAALESGKGTSKGAREFNNLFGVMDGKKKNPNTGYKGYHKSFESIAAGIDYTAGLLRRNYLNRGLRTIDAIGRVYCPPGDPNDVKKTNGGWPDAVAENYQILSRM